MLSWLPPLAGTDNTVFVDVGPVNRAASVARPAVQTALDTSIYRRITLLDARRTGTVAQPPTAATA